MQIPPDGHRPGEIVAGSELRRDVSVWGSYMWGYAAVGADIYTALGIITLAALGLAPVAFLAAGLVLPWWACATRSSLPPTRLPGVVSTTPCAAWATSGDWSPGRRWFSTTR